jgi:hypothetical protein
MLIIAFLVFIDLGNTKRVYCMKITSIETLHKSNHFVPSNNRMTYQHRTPNIINSKTPNFFSTHQNLKLPHFHIRCKFYFCSNSEALKKEKR